ncbi:MAG TPA: hypothetical protein VD999_06750 [Vitreimonas sp.]|nr:hypothetical protein [Vitreimonas sp.]
MINAESAAGKLPPLNLKPLPENSEALKLYKELLANELSGVEISWVTAEDWYAFVYAAYQGKVIDLLKSEWKDLFVVCFGGIHRSRHISNFLEELGFNFASNLCLRGYDLQNLADHIKAGDLKDGVVIPATIEAPVGTLLMCINTKRNQSELENISILLSALMGLQRKNKGESVRLKVMLIDGSESDTGGLRQHYLSLID